MLKRCAVPVVPQVVAVTPAVAEVAVEAVAREVLVEEAQVPQRPVEEPVVGQVEAAVELHHSRAEIVVEAHVQPAWREMQSSAFPAQAGGAQIEKQTVGVAPLGEVEAQEGVAGRSPLPAVQSAHAFGSRTGGGEGDGLRQGTGAAAQGRDPLPRGELQRNAAQFLEQRPPLHRIPAPRGNEGDELREIVRKKGQLFHGRLCVFVLSGRSFAVPRSCSGTRSDADSASSARRRAQPRNTKRCAGSMDHQ